MRFRKLFGYKLTCYGTALNSFLGWFRFRHNASLPFQAVKNELTQEANVGYPKFRYAYQVASGATVLVKRLVRNTRRFSFSL